MIWVKERDGNREVASLEVVIHNGRQLVQQDVRQLVHSAAYGEKVGIKTGNARMEPERGVCNKGCHERFESRGKVVLVRVKNEEMECILDW